MRAQVTAPARRLLHRLLHRFLSRSTGFQGFFSCFLLNFHGRAEGD